MTYCKTDVVRYKVIWSYELEKGRPFEDKDITKYLISHSSDESITISNNKI